MSGGSWDYFYSKFEDVCERLKNEKCIHRQALGNYLIRFVPALQAIEWVDSCDSSSPHDIDAIKKAMSPEIFISYSIHSLQTKINNLQEELDYLKESNNDTN